MHTFTIPRTVLLSLAALDLATTLPQLAGEAGALAPAAAHGPLVFAGAKTALTLAVLGIGIAIERLDHHVAFVGYAICTGVLVAAVGWNVALLVAR